MNKKGETNKYGSVLLGMLLFVSLIGVISGLARTPDTYDCFNSEYPHLNETDNNCYNATTGDLMYEESTNLGMSTTEKAIMGLMVVVLILGALITIKGLTNKKE